jgi:hypothetical protein
VEAELIAKIADDYSNIGKRLNQLENEPVPPSNLERCGKCGMCGMEPFCLWDDCPERVS